MYSYGFWSPLQSSRVDSWKSMFKPKGKEEPVRALDSVHLFQCPDPSPTGVNRGLLKGASQVTLMLSLIWNYFLSFIPLILSFRTACRNNSLAAGAWFRRVVESALIIDCKSRKAEFQEVLEEKNHSNPITSQGNSSFLHNPLKVLSMCTHLFPQLLSRGAGSIVFCFFLLIILRTLSSHFSTQTS